VEWATGAIVLGRTSQAGDVAVNPLAFGFSIPDTRAPAIRKVRVYELDERGLEQESQTITPAKLRDGNYAVNDTVIVTHRRIGLALKSYDRQNAMPNWNGIFGGDLYADSTLIFNFRFARTDAKGYRRAVRFFKRGAAAGCKAG